jgi:hypothetical protein
VRRQNADGAEVDEDDTSVVGDEDVSGMRVRVVHAIDEDHAAIRRHDTLRHRAPAEATRRQPGEVGDLGAFHEGRDEKALGAQVGNDRRAAHRRVAGELAGDRFEICRLAREIQLLGDHLTDLGMVRLESAQAGHALNERDDAAHRDQIGARDLLDVLVLYLDRHRATVGQAGDVDLRE